MKCCVQRIDDCLSVVRAGARAGLTLEAPLAEAGPTSGRRWNPWETASIRAVDMVGIGPLRVWVWRFRRPRFPSPEAVRTACRWAVSRP